MLFREVVHPFLAADFADQLGTHRGEHKLLTKSLGIIGDEKNGVVIGGNQDGAPSDFLAKLLQDFHGRIRVPILDVADQTPLAIPRVEAWGLRIASD
jgi:hypothetical protein